VAEFIVRLDKTDVGGWPRYNYEFRSSGVGGLEQEYSAEPSSMLVRQLCGKIDKIVRDALELTAVTADPVGDLARYCHSLYNALFPAQDGGIPDLARRLAQVTDSLLVRTNESDIPWELLHDGTDFFGLAHDIGRRKLASGRVVGGRGIGRLRRALVVGDPNDNLASARREAVELADWLQRHGVECELLIGEQATLMSVFEHLESGSYDLLHYCGHVAAPHGTTMIGLRLHNDELLDSRALQPLAKHGTPPVVFINGCESASRVSDLCLSFMAMGSKVAVGTRYLVPEDAARRFSERFYADLMSDVSAGCAIRAARAELRPHGGLAWTAFVLYGDPSARVSTRDTTTPRPAPAPADPAKPGPRFDREAGELMERVVEHAAVHGVVTSMDLLAELLSTEEVAGRLKRSSASAGRQALAVELLRTVLDMGPTTPVPEDAPIEYSDTVETVLAQAEQLAHDSGRALITVADLVTAYAAVGGGSSGQLLELFDISLAELAGGPRTEPAQEPPTTTRPSMNGHRPVDLIGTDDPLFDVDGQLRADRLEPTMVAAIRVAAVLASAQRTVVSTALLLYGIAVTDSELFGELMRAQGETGVAALKQLSLSGVTFVDRFSARTRHALVRAAEQAETGKVGELMILPEILADRTSSARQLLGKLGVDADRLLRDHQNRA
jgi:hypothetical protein